MTVDPVSGLNRLMPAFQVAPSKNRRDVQRRAWTWGFSGWPPVGAVPEPQSWQDILDPKYEGRVSGRRSDDDVGIASIAVGIDPDATTAAQLQGPIKGWLLELKSRIRALAPSVGDQVALLVSGDVD